MSDERVEKLGALGDNLAALGAAAQSISAVATQAAAMLAQLQNGQTALEVATPFFTFQLKLVKAP